MDDCQFMALSSAFLPRSFVSGLFLASLLEVISLRIPWVFQVGRANMLLALGNVFLSEDAELDLLGAITSFVDSLAVGILVADLDVELHM